MNNVTPFYLQKLRSEFEIKSNRNDKFSLRSFAKFLEMDPSTLSAVMKGLRRVPKARVQQVMNKLSLSPKEKSAFKETNNNKSMVFKSGFDHLDFEINEELHFKVIAEWEYYAILSLIETKGFKFDQKWIAGRLGITIYRVQVCIESLLALGLIVKNKTGIKLGQQGLKTTEDISSTALKKARRQDLELAAPIIDNVDVELRDLSSVTFTLEKKNIANVKEEIRNFRKRIAFMAEQKKGEEVYKLSVQLIPLTQINSNQGEL